MYEDMTDKRVHTSGLMPNYDTVEFDDTAKKEYNFFKKQFTELSKDLCGLYGGRSLALAQTKLEEAHMWVNKTIRDEFYARNAANGTKAGNEVSS